MRHISSPQVHPSLSVIKTDDMITVLGPTRSRDPNLHRKPMSKRALGWSGINHGTHDVKIFTAA
jgi:hypothetical protein